MHSARHITIASVATLAALLWTHSAIAEDQPASSSAPDVVATPSTASPSYVLSPPVSAPADMRRNPFGGKPLAAAALGARRGGDRVVVNDNDLKGVVTDNYASNLTTGMNVISGGAFTGAAGSTTVIQNSGNGVLIQNATIVNVQVK